MAHARVVRFNDPQEFLREIAQDKERIHRKIVRLTTLYTQSKTLPIMYVSVLATALIEGETPARDSIVRLEHFCGDIMGVGHTDEKTRERVSKAQGVIEGYCRDMDLDVRAGVYEAEKPAKE
ncbi:MAG TPA: hypothetical protein VNL14_16435 [Candidatus Acidoferrales bacterium]|nr:hypothetical protein [Candidatus Acidoferrales bacterium]